MYFSGKILKYEDGKWKEVGRDCNLKLNKVEGQVRKRESVCRRIITVIMIGLVDTLSVTIGTRQSKQISVHTI